MTVEVVQPTKAARTRTRILTAAAAEFALHGYAGTSLRKVAEEAGLQLGSLYFHFASKDQLLSEVVRDAVAFAEGRMTEALAALAPGADARSRFAAAVRAHLHALHESNDRGAAVVRILDLSPSLTTTRAGRHARAYASFWTGLVTEAQSAGVLAPNLDATLTRNLILGAMRATVGARQLKASQVDQLADTVIGLTVR